MKFYAVIGKPIHHSKSPRMHNNAFAKFKARAFYGRYELESKEWLKEKLFSLGLSGANITIPYKEQALQIADFKDDLAQNIGSANTLLIKDQKIYAYNTDASGFLKATEEFSSAKNALILGAGGTAKALAFVLKQRGLRVSVANRSKERLKDFEAYDCFSYDEFSNFDFDFIINTTPAGLFDDTLPCDKNLLDKLFSKAKYAFDAIYGKETPFLRSAKEHKVQSKDGSDMLIWQGVYAFEIFTGFDDEEKIYQAMKEALFLI